MQRVIVLFVGLIGIFFGMKFDDMRTLMSDKPPTVVQEEIATPTSTTTSDVSIPTAELYEVIKVVDGDTLAISIKGKSETLRLIGIDTPEMNDARTGVECFAKEATNRLKEMLEGHQVSIEMDASQGERDKYGRLLAYLFLDDGTFVSEKLIRDGYAYEYTYNQPYTHQKRFKEAQAEAKAGQRGLWAQGACPAPVTKKDALPPTQKSLTAAVSALLTQTPPTDAASTAPQSVESLSTPIAPTATTAPPPPKQEEKKVEPPPPPPTPSQSSNYTCSSNTYNCTDFTTHAEAQAVYDQCGGASNDIHKLDSNKDGEACESLP